MLHKDRESSNTSTSNDDELTDPQQQLYKTGQNQRQLVSCFGKQARQTVILRKGSRQDESHVCWFSPGDNFPTAGDPK